MAIRDDPARRKMLGILAGSWLAQGCYALARLGIADAIGDGEASAASLAAATGTDPVALGRLLRALAVAGLLRQPEPGRFALTPASRLLRRSVEGSVHLNALMQGDEVFRAFAEITHTLRTGEPAFTKVYGQPFYDYLEANPEAARTFHESMGDQPVPGGLDAMSLDGIGTLVDVGGGDGTLLHSVLAAQPGLRGVLFDLPEAVAVARRSPVAALGDRVSFVEGSFFDGVPSGGDAYVLSRVLHNWRDEQAVGILRRVRMAAAPGVRLIVLEEFLPADGGGAPGAGIVDLLMLVTLEGRDRTMAEYVALVERAGFVQVTAREAGDRTGVVEAVVP